MNVARNCAPYIITKLRPSTVFFIQLDAIIEAKARLTPLHTQERVTKMANIKSPVKNSLYNLSLLVNIGENKNNILATVNKTAIIV